ncbi:MAG: sugar transferase [Thermoleophilaceae bacterium]|nr:sugar transferase [Thermoleophilaceae bacterium]
MSAVTQIDPHASAPPPITHPAPSRGSAWNYALEREGWTSLLVFADALASLLAVLIALAVTDTPLVTTPEYAALFALPVAVPAMLHVRGVYRRRVRIALRALSPMLGAISVAAMAVLTWDVVVYGGANVAPVIGWIWVLTILLLAGARCGLALARRQARIKGLAGKPTLIVGAGVVGKAIAQRLAAQPEYGLHPVGFLDENPPAQNGNGAPHRMLPVLGTPADLAEVAAAHSAEHVMIAFIAEPDQSLLALARRCEQLGLEVSLVPRLFESMNDRVALDWVGSLPVLGIRPLDPKGWQFRVKYALDRPLALLGVLALSPLMAVVAIAVKLSSPGPILFRQRRIGQDGQIFEMLKFRSMCTPDEAVEFVPPPGFAPGGIEGPDRRTPIGRFLRRSGLDELPQLINVVRGEMSLVGPRPERPEFAIAFGAQHARYTDRHRVKSGITGWAQVSGLRGQTSLVDRVDMDNYYIRNWSLSLDLKIALLTVPAVLRTGDAA